MDNGCFGCKHYQHYQHYQHYHKNRSLYWRLRKFQKFPAMGEPFHTHIQNTESNWVGHADYDMWLFRLVNGISIFNCCATGVFGEAQIIEQWVNTQHEYVYNLYTNGCLVFGFSKLRLCYLLCKTKNENQKLLKI